MMITILKIVGIILLVLLGIILLLLLAILFVPIRYRIDADASEGTYTGRVKVTWLLHFLSVCAALDSKAEEKLTLKVKVLGINLLALLNRSKGKEKKPKKEKPSKKVEELKKKDPETYEELRAEALAKRKEEKEKIKAEEEAAKAQEKETLEGLKKVRGHKNTKLRQKTVIYANRLSRLVHKIIRAIVNISVTIYELPGVIIHAVGKFFQKVKKLFRTAKRWRHFLGDDRTHEAIGLMLRSAGKMIKHILPRKIKGHLTYGFDDPYQTGVILAAADSVYYLWSKDFTLTPDFENKVLEGKVFIKGHIVIFTFVLIGLKILFDRNIKFIRRFLKREKEINHG